jgi:hypothetical protein
MIYLKATVSIENKLNNSIDFEKRFYLRSEIAKNIEIECWDIEAFIEEYSRLCENIEYSDVNYVTDDADALKRFLDLKFLRYINMSSFDEDDEYEELLKSGKIKLEFEAANHIKELNGFLENYDDYSIKLIII